MLQRAFESLTEMGLARTDLEQLAASDVVEVSVPFQREDQGWEARILPWEYLLTAAAQHVRPGASFAVVRHLNARPSGTSRPPEKLLLVSSAPGRLEGLYDFTAEMQLVERCFEQRGAPRLHSPTLAELEAAVVTHQPNVVHISAIDARLGAKLLTGQEQTGDQVDGLLLRGEQIESAHATAEDLASALNAAATKPLLIGFNCYHSGARLAAMAVAGGAEAAIGFQTDFDDSLAELFFANLYEAWRLAEWELLPAFRQAWDGLAGHAEKVRGTGIILWSAQSLIEPATAAASRRAKKGGASVRELVDKRRSQTLSGDSAGPLSDKVEIAIRPHADANYSLLHNRRPLFESFVIRKLEPGVIRGLEVEVTLHVGSDTFPYRASLDLVEKVTDLGEQIVVPLTSTLARAVDENMQTTLHVRVSHEGRTWRQETHRMLLLPVDQWRDTDEDRRWLPSFVLPRSPAVPRIIASAQKYLKCLADDGSAGFDGYQSRDPGADDPWAGIDLQAQALWAALTFDLPLHYINPPPTYRAGSQRLRTPAQVLESGRGTCIDLTLLLAACLEYVEIYPVVFLLNGHAFPGYWRSEESYNNFAELKQPLKSTVSGGFSSDQDSVPWMVGRDGYLEVLQYVTSGDLVPLESVWLTMGRGFGEAVEEGANNLRSKRDFHSLTDIMLARDRGVTPLPL
jgi:hypothetical protein